MAVAATATRSRAPRPSPEFVAIAAIAVLAGVLRLWSLADVPGDPFYDAEHEKQQADDPVELPRLLVAAGEEHAEHM